MAINSVIDEVTVCVNQGTISPDMDSLEAITGIHPLPDMFYGDGYMKVNLPFCSIELSSVEAIKHSRVQLAGDPNSIILSPPSVRDDIRRKSLLDTIKVRQAEVWQASRDVANIPKLQTNCDWTFTTTYWGSILTLPPYSLHPKASPVLSDDVQFFPMDKLTNTSLPIRLFKEVTFWEDELDDNGHSQFNVRVRVMDDFVFLMSTFELRVDGVLESRRIETRIYADLHTKSVLREFKWLENGLVSICERERLVF